MRRHIRRRVLEMIPNPERTNRGNPKDWYIRYVCGHEDFHRPHYTIFYALAGVLSHGIVVNMCCSQCEKVD